MPCFLNTYSQNGKTNNKCFFSAVRFCEQMENGKKKSDNSWLPYLDSWLFETKCGDPEGEVSERTTRKENYKQVEKQNSQTGGQCGYDNPIIWGGKLMPEFSWPFWCLEMFRNVSQSILLSASVLKKNTRFRRRIGNRNTFLNNTPCFKSFFFPPNVSVSFWKTIEQKIHWFNPLDSASLGSFYKLTKSNLDLLLCCVSVALCCWYLVGTWSKLVTSPLLWDIGCIGFNLMKLP